jgi:hypothetical protein
MACVCASSSLSITKGESTGATGVMGAIGATGVMGTTGAAGAAGAEAAVEAEATLEAPELGVALGLAGAAGALGAAVGVGGAAAGAEGEAELLVGALAVKVLLVMDDVTLMALLVPVFAARPLGNVVVFAGCATVTVVDTETVGVKLDALSGTPG